MVNLAEYVYAVSLKIVCEIVTLSLFRLMSRKLAAERKEKNTSELRHDINSV
jgi:hypothetical protein